MKTWDDDSIAELRRRHARDESYGVIAAALDTTRGVIAGKVKRLGLRKRGRGRWPAVVLKSGPRTRAASVSFGTLPRYVAIREPTAPPPHEMTKREIEADFAAIWANTARLPSPP